MCLVLFDAVGYLGRSAEIIFPNYRFDVPKCGGIVPFCGFGAHLESPVSVCEEGFVECGWPWLDGEFAAFFVGHD